MYEEMQWLIIEFLMEKDLTSAEQELLPCSDETNISGTNIFRGRIYVYLYMYLYMYICTNTHKHMYMNNTFY